MRTAIAATAADLGTFLVLLAILGPAGEANPVWHRAIVLGGLAGVAAAVTAKVAVLVVLAAWRNAVGRLERPVWLVGLVIGAVGAASNLRAVLA